MLPLSQRRVLSVISADSAEYFFGGRAVGAAHDSHAAIVVGHGAPAQVVARHYLALSTFSSFNILYARQRIAVLEEILPYRRRPVLLDALSRHPQVGVFVMPGIEGTSICLTGRNFYSCGRLDGIYCD